MENTNEITSDYNKIQSIIEKYNKDIDEILRIFDNNIKHYKEQVRNDDIRFKTVAAKYNLLAQKIKEIGDLEISNLKEKLAFVNNNFEFDKPEYFENLSYRSKELFRILCNEKNNNFNNDLKDFTYKFELLNTSDSYFDESYKNGFNIQRSLGIKLSDKNLYAFEFFIEYKQITKEILDYLNNNKITDVENYYIKRYFKGILIVSDVYSDNPNVKTVLMTPEGDVFDSIDSIGPEFDTKIRFEEDFIAFDFNSLKPFRIGYRFNKNNEIEFYDIYDNEKRGIGNSLEIISNVYIRSIDNTDFDFDQIVWKDEFSDNSDMPK